MFLLSVSKKDIEMILFINNYLLLLSLSTIKDHRVKGRQIGEASFKIHSYLQVTLKYLKAFS